MEHSVFDFLGAALIPELGADIKYTLGLPIFQYGFRLYHELF